MFKKYSFLGIFLRILFVALLVAGGIALYRAGYTQGYVAGAAVEVSGDSITLPERFHPGLMPYRMHPKGFFPGNMIGLFFGGLLFFMGIAAVRRMMWFQRWRAEGGPEAEAWMGGWHACRPPFHHWGPPPWVRKDDSSQKEQGQPEE